MHDSPFHRYRRRRSPLVIGLMSGTSMDSIDVAAVTITDDSTGINTVRLEAFLSVPWPDSLTTQVADMIADGGVADICRLHRELGYRFGMAVNSLIEEADIPRDAVALVASHGQTVWHHPPSTGDPGSTLQLGDAATIADLTRLDVVADFRGADIAAGGQGAPLVPYVDLLLFGANRESRIVQNIGGIANCTYLPAGGDIDDIIAFDTGPGNSLIDAAATILTTGERHCDQDGQMALGGCADNHLVAAWLQHPYFRRTPPKSTGKELFGAAMAEELLAACNVRGLTPNDAVATITDFTAAGIVDAYVRHLPAAMPLTVIAGGGGVHNPALMSALERRLHASAGAVLRRHEDFGWNSDAKEALAFAVLGHEFMMGRPANVPAATGAAHRCLLGTLTPAPQFL